MKDPATKNLIWSIVSAIVFFLVLWIACYFPHYILKGEENSVSFYQVWWGFPWVISTFLIEIALFMSTVGNFFNYSIEKR